MREEYVMGLKSGRPGPDPWELDPPADSDLVPPDSVMVIEGRLFINAHNRTKRIKIDQLIALAIELGFVPHESEITESERPRRTFARRKVKQWQVQDYIHFHPGCTVRDLVDNLYHDAEPWSALHQRAAVLRANTALWKLQEIGWLRRKRDEHGGLTLYAPEHAV